MRRSGDAYFQTMDETCDILLRHSIIGEEECAIATNNDPTPLGGTYDCFGNISRHADAKELAFVGIDQPVTGVVVYHFDGINHLVAANGTPVSVGFPGASIEVVETGVEVEPGTACHIGFDASQETHVVFSSKIQYESDPGSDAPDNGIFRWRLDNPTVVETLLVENQFAACPGVCGSLSGFRTPNDFLDIDGDESPDDCDNCPGMANADQSDSDSDMDGIGDACESPCGARLLGDVNDDATFDINDLPSFADALLDTTSLSPDDHCAADINGDDAVDGNDIQEFLNMLIAP